MKRTLTSFSFWVVIGCIFVLTYTQFKIKKWENNNVITWDILEYYGYLPAFFIEKDLKLDFVQDKERMEGKVYFYKTQPDGSRLFKYTMGLSYFYAPFFFLAHEYAGLKGLPQTGFSNPYHKFISLAGLFYLLFGLLFLRKVLLRFFSEKVSGLTILMAVMATNLFHYSTAEAAMSHVFTFSVVSFLLWVTIKWHEKPSFLYASLLGFMCGLLFLIRPVNGLFVLIPLLYGLRHWRDIPGQLNKFLKHYPQLIVMLVLAFLVVLPQMLYWKHVTGSFFVYSYNDEKFFFGQPMILKGLFSFRKGWYIYTPIMFFATIGLWWVRKYATSFFWGILIFMALNLYVLMSWWCWWYGGSFGQRTLIDSYPLMALGLASLFTVLWKKRRPLLINIFAALLLVFFLGLNQLQSFQYRKACIHWDSMSREYYFAIFGKIKCPYDKQNLLIHPDYPAAIKGDGR